MQEPSKHTARPVEGGLHAGEADHVDGSPFDRIRQIRPDGSEFWSARDLQQLMAYGRWQTFEVPLSRAMRAAANTKMDVTSHFTRSRKVVDRAQGGGPDQDDYELSRQAAYLVAMNGDPKKSEVAAAQAYFAERTEQVETIEADLAGLPEWARHQIDTIRRVGKIEVEQKMQRERLDTVEARVDGIEGHHDWFAALAFAKMRGLSTSKAATQALGRAASRICRERGITPGKTQHELYGEVGSYPVHVLDEAAALILS